MKIIKGGPADKAGLKYRPNVDTLAGRESPFEFSSILKKSASLRQLKEEKVRRRP